MRKCDSLLPDGHSGVVVHRCDEEHLDIMSFAERLDEILQDGRAGEIVSECAQITGHANGYIVCRREAMSDTTRIKDLVQS